MGKGRCFLGKNKIDTHVGVAGNAHAKKYVNPEWLKIASEHAAVRITCLSNLEQEPLLVLIVCEL